MSAVKGSNSGKKCSVRRNVGMGSSKHDAFEEDFMLFRISSLVAGLHVSISVLLGGRRSETGRHVSGSALISDSVSEFLIVSIFP